MDHILFFCFSAVVEVSVIDANADAPMEDAVFPSADALKGSAWEKSTNSLRLPAESLRALAENGTEVLSCS